MGKSLMELIALLPIEEQQAVLADMDMDQLMWDWNVWARPEQLAPEGDDWNVWLIMAGRGFGKFLEMSTPILYTDGTSTYFKTIGDIQTGDTIFDENGKPTKVLQAHVPDIPKRMFRLTFSDGTTLDAGEEHQWVTWTHSDRKAYNRNVGGAKGLPDNWPQWKSTISRLRLGSRISVSTIDRAFELVGAGMSVRKAATKLGVCRQALAPHMQAGRNLHSTINYVRQETGVGPKIRNTQEIVDSFTYNDRGDFNHSIPVTGDVSTPIADLLIDPYLLGVFLGDGTTASSGFTQHRDDMGHLVDAISAAGYTPTEPKYRKLMHPNTGSVTARGLISDLRKIGVPGTKHIPAEYLYASADQRWELLAGLLDSDGFIDAKSGYIEFSNTNKNLADGVMFLARSLGQKPTMAEKKTHATAKNGTRTPGKLAYRIMWRPTRNFFKLPRKTERFIPLGNQASRNFHRMIVSFEEIAPVLSRCLTVDSPNSMYLAGEALIPTHNTRLGAEWVREQAKYTTTGQRRFGLVARTAADVRDVIVEGESGIMNISPPSEKPHYEPSKRRLTWPNGNTASLFTADEPDGLRGPQFRLDIATPIPTPAGWSTMGDLKVGDAVFDELGKPCNVTAVHEIELSLDSYRLNFSNGTHIDADGKHRWKVLTNTDLRYVTTHFDGVIPETWATKRFGRESTNHQVKDTNQLRANTKRRLYIPATKAVTYLPSSEPLPINPWVLGLVLGDGASAQPSYIATSTDDKSWLLEELERSGLVSRDMNKDHVWAAGLIGPWRELGLYKNKHVPEIYLRASAEDRLALLQGLTDSDGGVEPGGSFRFTNTNKALIDGYIELARSLGLVPKVYARKRRSRSGLQLDKQSWYVQVNSPIPLVRNPRKLAKARYEWKYQSTQHSIVSIAPTTPKFMRCITVDSASHLYLAGEGMVPTSNTHSWSDEVAAWRQTPDAAGMTAFDNIRVGTRLGANPQMVVTTTPKRVPLLYKLIEESKLVKASGSKVIITKGSTLDNAGNLSGAYLDTITGVYEGTSLAQQELYGEMLDDVDGALWTIEMIDKARELIYPPSTPLRVIGVDPSVAENPRDACGIVVCASTGDRDLYKRHAWVLEDATIHGSPEVWANKVVEMARRWGAPVVAEVNQGGALVRNAINAIDPSVKVLEVHSKNGKALRAEPIVLAYEQARIHHVNYLPELESQMTSWIPEQTRSSPDRVDALVHAMTALLIKPPAGFHGGKLTAKSPAARKLPPFRSGGGKVFNPNR